MKILSPGAHNSISNLESFVCFLCADSWKKKSPVYGKNYGEIPKNLPICGTLVTRRNYDT